MEDTFFTGRALSMNLQDTIFLALRRTYKTPAFFFKMLLYFLTLWVCKFKKGLGPDLD